MEILKSVYKRRAPPKKQLIGIANNLNQRLKNSHIRGIERMIKQVNLPLGNIDKILDKYNDGVRLKNTRYFK